MKRRNVFLNIIIILIILIQSYVYGQEYSQWHLPPGATARFGKGWVQDIKFSPLGDQLAVATTIGVWVYDVRTGKELQLFFGLMKDAKSISYSPGGLIIAAAHQDQSIRLWDIDGNNRRPLATFRGHERGINSVEFSPDGTMIASGSSDGTIRLWNPHVVNVNEQLLHILPYRNEITTVCFSPDSRVIAGGCLDGSIRVWDTGTGREIHTFENHITSIEQIDFSPDGTRIISASSDGTVILFSLVSPAGMISEPFLQDKAVYSLAFSQDGNSFVTGGAASEVQVWSTNNGNLKQEKILEGHKDVVRSVDVSPVGSYIASGSLDGTVRIWDAKYHHEQNRLDAHTGGVRALIYTADNRIRACGTAYDGKLRLWDAATGRQLSVLNQHNDLTNVAAFSLDGKILASAGDRIGKIVVSISNPDNISELEGNPHGITALALSPQATIIASGGNDGMIYLSDVETGGELGDISGATSTITAITFVSDGIHIFTGEKNGYVRHLNTETGEEIRKFQGAFSAITALAFSKDVEFIAIGVETGTIQLYDYNNRRIIPILTQHTRKITALLFSHDNKTLTSGSDDGTILRFDLEQILAR